MHLSSTLLRCLSIATCAATLSLAPALAHDVWVDRVYLVHFGDPGEKLDAFDPAKVTTARAVDASGVEIPVTLLKLAEAGVLVQPQGAAPAAISITWDGGYRVKKGEKWETTTKAEAEAAGTFRRTVISAERLFAWSSALAKPRGAGLELTADADPAAVKAGATLAVRAWRDGKPAAGLAVTVGEDHKTTFTSDAEGRIAVPLGAGLQIIKSRVSETTAGAEQIQVASLTVDGPAK